ncbi:MAG TPA: hypothetical protein VGH19_15310 [Verrucomicrobiae bacterium]
MDVKDDTFTHEITYPVFVQMNKNYPTFEPLSGKRYLDIEILEPGTSWNPDQRKISVRMPGLMRFFYFPEPSQGATTGLTPKLWIKRDEKNHRLLEIKYSYKNGEARKLTIDAEIKQSKQPE